MLSVHLVTGDWGPGLLLFSTKGCSAGFDGSVCANWVIATWVSSEAVSSCVKGLVRPAGFETDRLETTYWLTVPLTLKKDIIHQSMS